MTHEAYICEAIRTPRCRGKSRRSRVARAGRPASRRTAHRGENAALKTDIFGKVEKVVPAAAVLGSNTSTLPTTSLAAAVGRPEDFVGVHFFSPVDKMPLVEIIRGEATSDATLARAFDLVLEAWAAHAEGVIEATADANVGSLLGIGFPAWNGGVLRFLDQYEGGREGFVARAEELAGQYGTRFQPPASLIDSIERVGLSA